MLNEPISSAHHRPRAARGTRRAFLAWTATGAAIGAFGLDVLRAAPAAAQGTGQALQATPTPLGPAVPPEVADHAADWPLVHGNYAATRAAIDASISSETVGDLGVAWRFPLTAQGGFGAITCNPIVIGQAILIQDMANNIFALDRETGEVIWQHELNTFAIGPNGVAVGYGMVYATEMLGAQAFALAADTGEEVWRVRLSANPAEFIFMQPIVYDNVVYVGTSPGAYVGGTRGIFFALDASTGAVLWEWDTTTDNLWGNARINSGGGLWYPPSIDDAGNVYFGVGNPAPWPGTEEYPNGSSRPGDNLYSSSMVSLDTVTGSLRWYVQARPHDLVDHDFQNTPILATVEVDGVPTDLAIGSGKAGVVIAADAATGEIVWSTPVGEHTAAGDGGDLPPDEGVRVLPGSFGGVLTPMAFANDTVFVANIHWGISFNATSVTGADGDGDLAVATGHMIAINAVDGSITWQTEVPTFFCGGATVANDVVFGAGLDGIVRGFNIETGEEVWSFQAAAGVNATLVIADDLLLIPAGGFFLTALDPAPPQVNELIALRLGAVTPTASPAVEAATPIAGTEPAADSDTKDG